MSKGNVARKVVLAGVLTAAGALLVPLAPPAWGAKGPSAPVFSSKTTVKAKQGKALSFTVKTKAKPTAALSVTSPLPPGVSFHDNGNGTGTLSDPTPLGGTYTIALQATNTTSQVNTADQTLTLAVKSKLPLLRHVFVIMLENNGYSATFGSPSTDPYLATTLPSQGALLKSYYGTGHFSNDNYAALISGQPPNSANQLDCLAGYADFPPGDGQTNGIQQGAGCVYPTAVTTLANQLDRDGLTWKGYEEDMGNDTTRDGSVTCSHPAVGSTDPTTSAEAADGYTTRHNPFMYFHSIIDNTSECNQDVVPLGGTNGTMPAGTPAGVTGLAADLQSVATTPNFSVITPNLCDDGHDYPCTNTTGAGQGGGSSVADTDQWLKTWVPVITSSPAFKQDGLLEITFDEAETPTLDSTACCGETPGPAATSGGNGISGPGGGVVGAVLLSPSIAGNTLVTKTSYNHYSSLASFEDLFGLPRLGEAQTVTTTFDKHIYIR
ncbi:MAG: alkaline phosphatase family protein [Acidimicrobiales bacterium]